MNWCRPDAHDELMWEVILDTREGEWSASSTGLLTPGQLSLYTSDS